MAALLASLGLRAQVAIEPRRRPESEAEGEASRANLRADTNLVLVPVVVSDPLNRPITGLEQENFKIFDEGVEQKISQFSMDDEPVAVGLVFDVSGSMGDKLGRSRTAAATFFRFANPGDEFLLIQFDSAPKVVVPLTRDTHEITDHLLYSKSKGATALIDAIVLGLNEIKKSKLSRKALLVISDGGNNDSRYSDAELRNMMRETDALVYAIGIFGGPRTREEIDGPGYLKVLAERTGGRSLDGTPAELPDITAKIGIELRNRYVLGFVPTNQVRDGRYRPVQVKIIAPRGLPPLRASWRRGYYAPSD